MKEANLEVELDRFRLEKRLSMTRLLSEAAVGGGEPGPLTLPSMTPSPFFGPGQGGGGMGPDRPPRRLRRGRIWSTTWGGWLVWGMGATKERDAHPAFAAGGARNHPSTDLYLHIFN